MNNEEKIKVRDLPDASSLQTSDKLMILTDTAGNYVKNIAVSDFNANNISTDSLNYIMTGTDGKLFSLDPQTITGYLNNLNTNEKSNIVAAVNEVNNAAHSADFNNVVHKTGNETIAGVKTFSDSIYGTNDFPNIYLKSTAAGANWAQTPTSPVVVGSLNFLDKNNVITGFVHSYLNTTGDRHTTVAVRNRANTATTQLEVGYNSLDNIFTSAPACDNPNSIVTTLGISKLPNGYVHLGNGIIIQWGHIAVEGTQTVTFPIAMSNTDYIVLTGIVSVGSGNQSGGWTQNSKTTTTVTFQNGAARGLDWLVIGY